MFESNEIEKTIEGGLRGKLQNYNPEPNYKPFHTRLLGRDRMALFSFIHSLNTTFGTSIFERVAVQIASGKFEQVVAQYEVSGKYSLGAQEEITSIINDLTTAKRIPDHILEMKQIRARCRSGGTVEKDLPKADLFLSEGREIFLIDLKTTKPNKGNFREFKQTMLEWAASALYQDSDASVRTIIAMPYNPYAPRPYERWTIRGMLDIQKQRQLLVGEELWNFLAGGQDIYEELLTCFENVGFRMREEIDDYFKELGKQTYN